MALTNAERQARYRTRQKQRAAPDPAMAVEKAVVEAVEALWTFFNRPAPDGLPWGDVEGCSSVSDYRTVLAGNLVPTCRAMLWSESGMTEPEVQAIRQIAAMADLMELKPNPR